MAPVVTLTTDDDDETSLSTSTLSEESEEYVHDMPFHEELDLEYDRYLRVFFYEIAQKQGKPYNFQEALAFMKTIKKPYFDMEAEMEAHKNVELSKEVLAARERRVRQFKREKLEWKHRKPIFHTFIFAVSDRFSERIKDLLEYNAAGYKQNMERTFQFPDQEILRFPGYVRVRDEEYGDIQLFQTFKQRPCFFPWPTKMNQVKERKPMTRQELFVKFLVEQAPVYEDCRWYHFLGEHLPTVGMAVENMRAQRGRDTEKLYGLENKHNAYWCARAVVPRCSLSLSMHKHLGKITALQKVIKDNDIRSYLAIRAGMDSFEDVEDASRPAPTVQEAMDVFLEELENHFFIWDAENRTKLMTKVLDYLCPGVMEVIATAKK